MEWLAYIILAVVLASNAWDFIKGLWNFILGGENGNENKEVDHRELEERLKQLEAEKEVRIQQRKLAEKEGNRVAINRRVQDNPVVSKFKRYDRKCLWHITHKKNVPTILRNGLMSKSSVTRAGSTIVDIADPEVQERRGGQDEYYNRPIHEYVPLYINPRNPMLFKRKVINRDLCLLQISLDVLLPPHEYLLSDGNVASSATKLYDDISRIDQLPWEVLDAEYWSNFPDGKRQRCSEVLIYPQVEPKLIQYVHCYSAGTRRKLAEYSHRVKMTPKLFF